MKRKPFPFWILGLIGVLLGAMVALNVLNQKNGGVEVFAEHDHDHDGKPDHGDDVHDTPEARRK